MLYLSRIPVIHLLVHALAAWEIYCQASKNLHPLANAITWSDLFRDRLSHTPARDPGLSPCPYPSSEHR